MEKDIDILNAEISGLRAENLKLVDSLARAVEALGEEREDNRMMQRRVAEALSAIVDFQTERREYRDRARWVEDMDVRMQKERHAAERMKKT